MRTKRVQAWVTAIAVFAMLVMPFGGLQLNVATAAGVQVTGKLVSPSGAALSGIGGWAQLDPLESGMGTGEPVQSDGTFTLNNIAAGQYRIMLSYSGSGNYTTPAPFNITVGSSNVNMGNIKLVTPAISGVLLPPSGSTPVTEANVSLRSQDYSVNLWTRSDTSDGTFKFGGITPGVYFISAEAPAGTGYAGAEVEVEYTGAAITGYQLRLTTPNVAGTIVSSTGAAVTFPDMAWFNVRLHNADYTVQRNANVDRTTHEFVFGTVPTGTYTIEFEAQGFSETAPATITTAITAGVLKNLGNIKMTKSQLQGTITNPHGDPVQNANVQVHDQNWQQNKWANTDENGQYRIGGLPAGTYIVEIQPPWGGPSGLVAPEPAQVTLTTSSTVTKNIQFIQATKFLRGQVRYVVGTGASAAATGGVANAQVNVNKEGGFGFANTTTDSSGNYEIALSGGIWNVNVQPNMQPGAPAADWFYGGPPLRIDFANNSTAENKTLNIGVEKATATLKGKIVKNDGSPVTQASVDARDDRGAGQSVGVNPDGTFMLRLKAGSYRLNVWADQSLTFPEIPVNIKDGEIKNIGFIKAQTKDARIVGKFIDGSGNPVQGLQVNAFKHDGPGWSNATSDAEGQFVLAVTKGRWGVNMDFGGNASYVYSGQPVDVDIVTDTSIVSFQNNARLVMKLTRADATITGKVVDTEGNVVTGFCAWAWAQPTSGTKNEGGYFEGPRYGGPVNCQNGSFTMNVPSKVASTFTIGIDTPPNTQYSPAGTQTVAVLADATVTKNLVVKQNDATLKGKIVDQNGKAVTNCTSPRGWFGDVHVFGNGGWKGGPINPDCTFSFSLVSGTYNYGFWIDDSRFLQTPPKEDKITVKPGENTLNLTALKADILVEGRVIDPQGNGVDAFVWAGNTGGKDKQQTGPEEINPENNIFTGAKTEPDGTFSLGLLSGQVWEVGTGLPPGSDFMPADLQTINLQSGTAPSGVVLQLRSAIGKMTGTVKIGNENAQFGFVHCWSEEGGFTGGEVFGGAYEVNYVSGAWHCQADSYTGSTFYQSDEVMVNVTDQKNIAQDFTLAESIFTIPPTVSATFDAGEVRNLELENGVRINIPSGALGDSGSSVTVTAAPNINVNRGKADKLFGVGYELKAQDSSGTEITSFSSNVTITFPYTDEQIAALGVTEDTLVPKYYDQTTSTWKIPNGISQDIENNTITIQTNHFTTFGLVSAGITTASGGAQKIVASAKAGGGPHVTVWDSEGNLTGSFMAYAETFRGGVNAMIGDVDGDGVGEVVTVPDSTAGGQVRAFEQDGTFIGDIWPYGSAWRGTLSLALGDVDGDGSDEVILAPKSDGGPHVRVYNFTPGEGFGLHSQFMAYTSSLRTGIKVYSHDVAGDGVDEIITVPMPGAPAHVRVLNQLGEAVGQFYAFPVGYRGSANISFGDGDRNGTDDLVITPYLLGGPQVRIIDGGGNVIYQEFLWNSNYRLGIEAALDDTWDAGHMHIMAVVSQGGGPQMRTWDIDPGRHSPYSQWFAYNESFRGGVSMVAADIDSDGYMEEITAAGPGGGPHIRSFEHGYGTAPELNFMSHASAFRGGVNINVGR